MVVTGALAGLAAAIGDRSGLAELQELFSSLDTDGNGTLDVEEV
jgi:Ca2+-binding EF-hand superfamily protein